MNFWLPHYRRNQFPHCKYKNLLTNLGKEKGIGSTYSEQDTSNLLTVYGGGQPLVEDFHPCTCPANINAPSD